MGQEPKTEPVVSFLVSPKNCWNSHRGKLLAQSPLTLRRTCADQGICNDRHNHVLTAQLEVMTFRRETQQDIATAPSHDIVFFQDQRPSVDRSFPDKVPRSIMVLIDKVPSVEARRNKWRRRLAKFLLGKVGPATNTFLLPEQYWCGIIMVLCGLWERRRCTHRRSSRSQFGERQCCLGRDC